MTLWHNDPAKDSDFNRYGGDISKTSASFKFDELVVKEEQEGKVLGLYFFATEFRDVSKAGNKGWKFEPSLCVLHLTLSEFEKEWTTQDGKKETKKMVPSPTELLLGNLLLEAQKKNEDKAFKGFIDLGISEKVTTTLSTGTWTYSNKEGKELTENDREMLLAQFIEIQVTELSKLKDAKFPEKKSGTRSWGSGSKGQTESEKLKERFEFLKATLGVYGEGSTDLVSLALALNTMSADSPKLYAEICHLLPILFNSK